MNSKFFLAIPIIIGMVVGVFLAFNMDSEDTTTLLTTKKLIEHGSPIMGDKSAPITILEWGDYQCTFCYKFHQSTLDIIKQDYIKTGKVNLVFKDYPLNGPDSVLGAEASHCAEDQGKFWEFHNELYQNWAGERTGWITRESLESFALTVNLDVDIFNKCLDEHKYLDRVNQLHAFGKQVGIDATPSFLIFNGEKVIKITGNQPLEVFLKTFDEL